MRTWILAAATLLLLQGVDARERRGPPSACPRPKVDCDKPKCPPKVRPVCDKACNPDPCCPPVCFEKGYVMNPCCTPSAYSEPADIDLRCGWDTFVTANFIYWEVIQGAMDLAIPNQGTVTGGQLVNSTSAPSCTGEGLVVQGTSYTPGFQVGFGWGGPKDHWVAYAEYTWLHGSTTTTADAVNPTIATLNGTPVPQTGFLSPLGWMPPSSNFITPHLSSTWKYRFDLVDGQISRPFYSGTRVILEPFFGVRGAFLRQNLYIATTNFVRNLSDSTTGANGPTRIARYSSRGNGVGPRIGLNGEWHMGYGTRFIGNVAASVLYTQYDVKQNVASSDMHNSSFQGLPQIVKLNDFAALRPNVDLSLGFGWGTYLRCRRYHIDFAATYDVSVFWSQNMMRYLAEATLSPSSSISDLYLHGLTIHTRFDF